MMRFLILIGILKVVSFSSPLQATNDIIDEMLKKHNYSGVVLACNSHANFHKAYSSSFEDPIVIDSLFPIASIAKTLTSAIALLELEKRNISLDTPIQEVVTLSDKWDARIQFSDLLSHRSGIGDYTNFSSSDFHRASPLLEEDFLKSVHDAPTVYGKFSYNNGNYILLEMILKKLTHKTYSELLKEYFVEPLKMDCTDVIRKTQEAPLILGRTKHNTLAAPIDYAWLGAGAGIYSTSSDLHKFALSFMHRRVLPFELMKQAWTDQGGNYGYGWSIKSLHDFEIYFHEGGIDGFSSMLMIEPKTSSILIMLSNREIDINSLSISIFAKLITG